MGGERSSGVGGVVGVGPPLIAVALAAGPVAWVVHLVASVALVPHACEVGTDAALHAVTVVTALAAGAGLVAAARIGRRARGERDGPEVERALFLVLVARVLGVLFLVLIVVEAVPVLVLDPCG